MDRATLTGEIVTYTGEIVRPLDPDPDSIKIEDIAHSLSNQCRFCGHTKHFYSVAQHSILVSRILSDDLKLWGLLHDASEAYLSDIARPIKAQEELGAAYKIVEERLMEVIADVFDLDWPMPYGIKTADQILLRTEQRDLMPNLLRFEGDVYLPEKILPVTSLSAERFFLEEFSIITGA